MSKPKLRIKTVPARDFAMRQTTIIEGEYGLKSDKEAAETFLHRYDRLQFVAGKPEDLMVRIGYY